MSAYRIIAVDTEGALIRPGRLVPDTVCMSYAERVKGQANTGLAPLGVSDDGLILFESWLDDPNVILVFKNSPFDNGVLINKYLHLMVKVFNAYAQGRIRDVGTRQELLDIWQGRISEGGKTFVFDKGDWRPRNYTLAGLEKMYGISDRIESKSNKDTWRYKYASLGHLPIESWPAEAVEYAKEDASGTLLVYEAQTVVADKNRYLCPHAKDRTAIVDETNQSRAQWALFLMSAWGIRTDPAAVQELETRLYKARDAARRTLIRFNILRPKKCTAAEVAAGKVDFYETVTKSRKATKKELITLTLPVNCYIKDGRYCVDKATPYRYGQDKKRLASLVEAYYTKAGKTAPRLALTDRDRRGGAKQGNVSTDKDTLYGSGSRLLKLSADGGGVEKIINTYLPVLHLGTQFPINVSYNVLVNSGRTSAYGRHDDIANEQSGCNIQNLPTGRRVAGTRECFVPRKGHTFSSVDYNTLELRSLAQVCFWLFGKSRMLEVLNTGRDLHLAMAADMLHISYEDAERAYKSYPVPEAAYGFLRVAVLETFKVDIAHGDAYKDRLVWAKKVLDRNRDCAKVANFGLPGGLGADSLIFFARSTYNVTLTREQAVALITAWKISWPEMKLYFTYINGKVGHQKELAKVVQFWSGRVRGNMGYCDACNTLFQGLAADGAKLAMFRILYEMYCVPSSPLYGSRMVAFIHDEFLCEHPDEKADAAARRVAELAVEEMKKVLPDVAVTAEPALMKRWYKKAEKVLDAAGRLIPWEPKKEVA